MSKSYHVTNRDLKGKTPQEIDEMIEETDSILHQLAETRMAKKEVKKLRKLNKEQRDD